MKILHIAGWSGSGKTTYILQLCSHLVLLGKTATIKHIGSHHSKLPAGKDSTLHFQSGADPAIGIDEEKTSACFHSVNLDDTLNFLSDAGVQYAVIEGFKSRPFQKILIGDLDCSFLLKSPEIPQVLSVLDQFDDWYTLPGLVNEMRVQHPDDNILTWSGYTTDYKNTVDFCAEVEKDFLAKSHITSIRIRVQKWSDTDNFPVYVALSAKDPLIAVQYLSDAMQRISPYVMQSIQENRSEKDPRI